MRTLRRSPVSERQNPTGRGFRGQRQQAAASRATGRHTNSTSNHLTGKCSSLTTGIGRFAIALLIRQNLARLRTLIARRWILRRPAENAPTRTRSEPHPPPAPYHSCTPGTSDPYNPAHRPPFHPDHVHDVFQNRVEPPRFWPARRFRIPLINRTRRHSPQSLLSQYRDRSSSPSGTTPSPPASSPTPKHEPQTGT